MPEAQFRRYHNASTYAMLLEHYQITDKGCIYISKIVHDIEINTWEKKVMPESHDVQKAIQLIITQNTKRKDIIEKGIIYFDKLYANKSR